MKEKLAALYALQQQDSALDALKRAFAALDPGREEKTHYEAAKAAYETAEAGLHKTSGELQDAELEQKSIEAKRAEYEKKLYSGKVTAMKELQAMQDEIEMLGRQRGRLDEKILALMDTLEAQRKQAAETKQAWSAATKAFQTVQANYKKEAETIKGQAQVVVTQRGDAAKAVAPDLMRRYESLRASKGGLAIVPLEDGNACGGCKMGLSSNQVQQVHQGQGIELCDNCGRILTEAPE